MLYITGSILLPLMLMVILPLNPCALKETPEFCKFIILSSMLRVGIITQCFRLGSEPNDPYRFKERTLAPQRSADPPSAGEPSGGGRAAGRAPRDTGRARVPQQCRPPGVPEQAARRSSRWDRHGAGCSNSRSCSWTSRC